MDLLLIVETNDAVFHNGPLTKEYTTQPFTQTVGQRLRIRLQTFLEEWFWDTTYGVPYYQSLLGHKQVSKTAADLIFQSQILAETGVKEITYFKSTFVNRKYSLVFQAKVVNGENTDLITLNNIN